MDERINFNFGSALAKLANQNQRNADIDMDDSLLSNFNIHPTTNATNNEFWNKQTALKILCCTCGVIIEANPLNMCINCLKTRINIAEDLPKQASLQFCRGCDRYLQNQGNWIHCELESKELLALCLKKLRNLNKVNIVDASFIWTEPHSKRLKVKIILQKDVYGALIQQAFTIEYSIFNKFCEACHRREAKDFWRAVVQLRQKVQHKRTFFYLEQVILKHKMHLNCTNVKPLHEGIDFFFDKKDDARKMVDFLQTVVPCQYSHSQQLISHDTHSNVYNYKHTFSVEIVPICKDDVVCLPPVLAASLGHIGQLCICLRVTNHIILIDPFTSRVAELSANNYWRHPFISLANSKDYTEYLVLDIDIIDPATYQNRGTTSKYALAEVWVKRLSTVNPMESEVHTFTHLGHILNIGDTVLGFNISNANLNNEHFEKYERSGKGRLPDVIIIKKYYGDKLSRNRNWKLKRIVSAEEEKTMDAYAGKDMNDFMNDLVEDPDLRQGVNIYKNKFKIPNDMAVDIDELEDELVPKITLQEMLEDLDLNE